MTGCVFCRIAEDPGEAAVVLDEGSVLAFLDHRPLFPGHCLLIPRQHYDTLPDLPAEMLGQVFGAAQRLSSAMEIALGAEGAFVAINNRVSQSVPHLHVHVVPRRRKDGLKGFFWPRSRYRDEGELQAVRDKLRAALQRA